MNALQLTAIPGGLVLGGVQNIKHSPPGICPLAKALLIDSVGDRLFTEPRFRRLFLWPMVSFASTFSICAVPAMLKNRIPWRLCTTHLIFRSPPSQEYWRASSRKVLSSTATYCAISFNYVIAPSRLTKCQPKHQQGNRYGPKRKARANDD
jgi:hypothetical protein